MRERKRLNAFEYNSLLSVTGAYSELNDAAGKLEKRARETPTAYRMLRIALGCMKRAMKELLETVPSEKLNSIKKDLDHTITITRVTYGENKGEDAYRWVNSMALSNVVFEAAQYHCGMCDKHGPEISKCTFRSDINSLFPFDIAVMKNGDCSMNGSFGVEDFAKLSEVND